MKKWIPLLLSLIILCVSVYFAGNNRTQPSPSIAESDNPALTQTADSEMRGVWISYMTLDTEGEDDPKAVLTERIKRIITQMKDMNLNTMIVQVRPFSDALYRSSYYPWSHILTGTQGEDPGFDPMKLIIEEAHTSGIAVHAWVNPYRVKTAETPKELSQDSPYIHSPALCKEWEGAVYLDPSDKSARELITDGVREIAENYAVDGIQFDDYFYPTSDESFDREEYDDYCENTASPLSLDQWRKENVNSLIRDVYKAIHSADDRIVFGIAPQGNLRNNEGLYADVSLWCDEEGYVDYICPQIYFSLDNPALSFEDALSEWLNLSKHEKLKLYVGLACYKAGTDADEGTWLDNDDIIKTEAEIIRENTLDGFMLYSADSFEKEENQDEMDHLRAYLNSSPTQ